MKRAAVIVSWLLFTLIAQAQGVPGAWAVLRINSHGCSGTVIHVSSSAEGPYSDILSCAHMFLAPPRRDTFGRLIMEPDRIDPEALARSFIFDAPHPRPGADPKAGVKLLKYDIDKDLCLIRVYSRLPYVCPVAVTPSPGPAWSVGYDHMQWPAVVRPATRVSLDSFGRQLTMERPAEGRSGGPMLTAAGVVGVCTGYTGQPNPSRGPALEIVPGSNGIYVSQASILTFLGTLPKVAPVPVASTAPQAPPAVPWAPWDGSYRQLSPLKPQAPVVGESYTPPRYMPPAGALACPPGGT